MFSFESWTGKAKNEKKIIRNSFELTRTVFLFIALFSACNTRKALFSNCFKFFEDLSSTII